MRLKSVGIHNFKSYDEVGPLELAPKMNLVIGQNNVGKTSFLQALSGRFIGAPHRHIGVPEGTALNPQSTVSFVIGADAADIRNVVLNRGRSIHIPVGVDWGGKPTAVQSQFLSRGSYDLQARMVARPGDTGGWETSPYPSHNLFQPRADTYRALLVEPNETRSDFKLQLTSSNQDTIGQVFGSIFAETTYLFEALRVPSPSTSVGTSTILFPDARNLAEVLLNLSSNRVAYAKYNELVSRVLPSVRWVGTKIISSNQVEIRVWSVDDATMRDDLSFPLSQCGTGIGQVLAILYVATRSQGSLILIDEPNSFLHPRASRELMSIISEHSQNQYVIATHSVEVLGSSDPEKIFLMRLENGHVRIDHVDQENITQTRAMIDEVGARLSDLLGADRIVWVEGPTESRILPRLLAPRVRNGTVFVPMRNTGDFEGRNSAVIADIYRNVTSATVLIPAASAMLFDGDKRSSIDAKAIGRAFGVAPAFLQRWEIEGYFLDPGAISAVLNSMASFTSSPVDSSAILAWIQTHGNDTAFGAQLAPPMSTKWLESVRAARLLQDMVTELSQARDVFRKPAHSVALALWLLEHKPEHLRPLLDEVSPLVADVLL